MMAPPPQPQLQRRRRLSPPWLAHARSLLGGGRRSLLAGVLYYYEESTDEEPINWIQLDAKTEIKVHPEDFMRFKLITGHGKEFKLSTPPVSAHQGASLPSPPSLDELVRATD
jgi:hypothetical protein|eukprot:COSAG01_NODE_38526_length_488_cov_1.704370_1_plen_112_part_10